MAENGFLRLQHVSIPMPPGGNAAARTFYGDILGLTEAPVPSSLDRDALVWFRIGVDGHELHVFTEESGAGGSPGQHLCFQVTDLAALRERLRQHDVTIEETTPITNRPRCFIRDPFGNRIELTEIRGDYN